jgi:hypothetical protein
MLSYDLQSHLPRTKEQAPTVRRRRRKTSRDMKKRRVERKPAFGTRSRLCVVWTKAAVME